MKKDDVMFFVGFLVILILAFTVFHPKKQGEITVTSNVTRAGSSNNNTSQNSNSVSSSNNTSSVSNQTNSNNSSNNSTSNIEVPKISYLSTRAGPIGSEVIIHGQGFMLANNTIHFGSKMLSVSSEKNGTILTFKVPSININACPAGSDGCYIKNPQSILGTYEVAVSNTRGVSNAVNFTITEGQVTTEPPIISAISGPSELDLNSEGVWTIGLETEVPTSITVNVNWGDESSRSTVTNSKTFYIEEQGSLIFTHKYSTTTDRFPITFTAIDNYSGLQTKRTQSLVVNETTSGEPTTLTLRSMLPYEGKVGTQVTLKGTGFSSANNILKFGSYVYGNISSYNNGTSIIFSIPVVPTGDYPISVINSFGQTTSALYFRVVE